MSASAKARRTALRKLLMSGLSGTQQELCDRLQTDGHTATQSTISRDLKRLGAMRVLRDDGNFAYHLRGGAPGPFPAEMVLRIDRNESLIVIRTKVGRAQAVGLDIDAMGDPDILGTLAGDDTVLVIPRSTELTSSLASRLSDLAGLAPD